MAIQKNFIVNAGLEVGNANVAITSTGNVAISNNVTISNAVAIGNTLTVGNTLVVSGSTTLQANLAVTGNVTQTGNSLVISTGTVGSPTRSAALTVARGTSPEVSVRWNETTDTWQLTTDGSAFGNIHTTLTDIILGTHTSGSYVATIESNTAAITFSASGAEGAAVVANVRSANTTTAGITQLLDSVSSTSDVFAATANSVKRAYDTAIQAYANAETFSSNATNLTNGLVSYGRIPSNIVNTTASFTITGVMTHAGNTIFSPSSRLFANGVVGNDGQVLTSNSTGQLYWNTPVVYVSSVQAGNGLAGGPITTTGSLSVLANTGLISNSTGVHVNSSFVAAVTSLNANNAAYFAGQLPAYYLNAGNLSTGLVPTARLATGTANTSTYLRGDQTWASFTAGVTSVTGGAGLTGGTIGDVTLNVGEGVGITVAADSVGVRVTTASALTANSSGLFVNITDSTSTTSSTTAASASAVKSAYDLAASKGFGTVTSITGGSGLSGGTITASGTLSVAAGTGITSNSSGVHVNLTDSTSLTSSTTAASATAVKSAYDLANGRATTAYVDGKASTAYSNATSYADTRAATAYSNATSYADSRASTAYSNAISFASNGGNITSGTISADRLGFTQSLGFSTGYTKLPNGVILQWGQVSAPSVGSSVTVSLPILYQNSYKVLITAQGDYDDDDDGNEVYFAVEEALSYFRLYNATPSDSLPITFSYFTIGY